MMNLMGWIGLWFVILIGCSSKGAAQQLERPEPGVRLLGRKQVTGRFAVGAGDALRFSPDGKQIVGFSGKRVLVFDSETQLLTRTVSLPVESIAALAFSDRQWLVLGVRRQERDTPEIQFEGHEQDRVVFEKLVKQAAVEHALFELDAEFEIESETVIDSLPWEIQAEGTAVPVERYAFLKVSPNDLYFALVGNTATRIFNRSTKEEVAMTREGDPFFCFLNDREGCFLGRVRKHWMFLESATPNHELPAELKNAQRLWADSGDHDALVFNSSEDELFVLQDRRVKLMRARPGTSIHVTANGRWLTCIKTVDDSKKTREVHRFDLRSGDLVERIDVTGYWPGWLQVSPQGDRYLYFHRGGFEVVSADELLESLRETASGLPTARQLQFFGDDQRLLLDQDFVVDVKKGDLLELEYDNIAWEGVSGKQPLLVGRTMASSSGFSLFTRRLANASSRREFQYQLPEAISRILKLLGSHEARRHWLPYVTTCRLSKDDKQIYVVFVEHKRGLRYLVVDRQNHEAVRTVDLETDVFRPTFSLISADGEIVVLGGPDGVQVFETANGQSLLQLEGSRQALPFLSRDGASLALLQRGENRCRIYDIGSGKRVKTLSDIACCGFSQGTNRFFAAEKDGKVTLFETESFRTIQSYQTEYGVKQSGAISKDGRELAFGLDDTRLEIWSLEEITK